MLWHLCHTSTSQNWHSHQSWCLTHNVTLPKHKDPFGLIRVWQATYWLTSQRLLVSTYIGFCHQPNDTYYQSSSLYLPTLLSWLMGHGSEWSSVSVSEFSQLICIIWLWAFKTFSEKQDVLWLMKNVSTHFSLDTSICSPDTVKYTFVSKCGIWISWNTSKISLLNQMANEESQTMQ